MNDRSMMTLSKPLLLLNGIIMTSLVCTMLSLAKFYLVLLAPKFYGGKASLHAQFVQSDFEDAVSLQHQAVASAAKACQESDS